MVQFLLCNFLRLYYTLLLNYFTRKTIPILAHLFSYWFTRAFLHLKKSSSSQSHWKIFALLWRTMKRASEDREKDWEKSHSLSLCWTIDIKLFWKPISNAHNSILMCCSPKNIARGNNFISVFSIWQQVKWASRNFSLPTKTRLSAFNYLNERSLTALSLYRYIYMYLVWIAPSATGCTIFRTFKFQDSRFDYHHLFVYLWNGTLSLLKHRKFTQPPKMPNKIW